jgi:hypothetical protein
MAAISLDFCLNVQTLSLTAASTPANTTLLSTHGATPFTLYGSGFDAKDCSKNKVYVGNTSCIVTDCSADMLHATFPGSKDSVAQKSNLNSTSPGLPQNIAVEVLDTDSGGVARANLSGGLSMSSGGADAPFCAISSSDAMASGSLGSQATLNTMCSTAALGVGVMSLHMVHADIAGVVGDVSVSRRMRQGARRLNQEPSEGKPVEEVKFSLEEQPMQQPIPCRVRAPCFS